MLPPDGTIIVTGSEDATVARVWDAHATLALRLTLSGHNTAARGRFTRHSYILTGSCDKTARCGMPKQANCCKRSAGI
jgi:WD40 repeat protein